ncbi:FecR domain-containing protein [Azonexus sp.]|uniref:FecR family protein n=1 Tax=Azonexus sp. TaxID=1872668 RepID=UPI0027B8865A|nr:FecR domain-containing protein [Azonexus sp.]
MRDKYKTAEDEALQWFIRSQASDFSATEREHLDAWLADDTAHRDAFDALGGVWARLDELGPLLPEQARRIPRASPRLSQYPWQRLRSWSGALAMATVVAFVFLLPQEESLRTIESLPGQHRQVTLADGTHLALDADSTVRVSDALPPRIELLKGKLYLEVAPASSGQLEVRAGAARIRDIGTRFAVNLRDGRGQVAVAEGQVEIKDDQRLLMLLAGRGADFGPQGLTGERAIPDPDIAPWRDGRWRFSATPLLELGNELAHQHRIRLDIPDPRIAALTVSGSFPISEPDRVLWAVAQVHALKLERIAERHYRLRKT